jgi:hypothetical protein
MPENLKPVLSALRKLEYQNQYSLPRLIFLNGQAQSAILNAIRRFAGGEQGIPGIDEQALVQEFTLNLTTLQATTLTAQEQKLVFDQVHANLTLTISSFLQKIEKSISRKRQFAIC